MSRTWSEYVLAGEAFSVENFVIGAGGLLAHIQLMNPAGSGKRIRLRHAHAIFVTAVVVNVRRYDTPLTTLGLPAGFIVENLLGGQPVGVAEHRSESPVATLGSAFWALNAPANQPASYPAEGREWGFDLLPAQGLVFQFGAGVTGIVNWQYAEVDE